MRIVPKADILRDYKRGMNIVRLVHKYQLGSDIIVEILKKYGQRAV